VTAPEKKPVDIERLLDLAWRHELGAGDRMDLDTGIRALAAERDAAVKRVEEARRILMSAVGSVLKRDERGCGCEICNWINLARAWLEETK